MPMPSRTGAAGNRRKRLSRAFSRHPAPIAQLGRATPLRDGHHSAPTPGVANCFEPTGSGPIIAS